MSKDGMTFILYAAFVVGFIRGIFDFVAELRRDRELSGKRRKP